jgi:hypothetical protein
MKLINITVVVAALLITTGATAYAIQESSRASAAEKSLADARAKEKAYFEHLYGVCTKSDDYDNMSEAQKQACVGMDAALTRNDGKAEPSAVAAALGFLKPDANDAMRDRLRTIVHEAYTDFAPLNPSQVYGAVYEQEIISEKFADAFKQN